ncbi:MAG: 50S ribosomal protein L21 [bacterium]
MYAIVETGGRQYRMEVGSTFEVNKIKSQPGSEISLDKVLLVADGEKVSLGNPYVSGASVIAQVLEQERGKKIIVFKKKPKKGFKRKHGHRQYLTKLEIKEIKV